ncbi:hypothetical protein [Kitasatospora sp. NPDC088351]
MKRTLAAALVGAAALTTLGTATASAAPLTTSTPTTTCAAGFAGVLATTICADVTDNQVKFYGFADTDPRWSARQVAFSLSGSVVGGASLGTLNTSVLVPRGGTRVGDVTGTAPCGSSVTGEFKVTEWGWAPSTATVTVPVTC